MMRLPILVCAPALLAIAHPVQGQFGPPKELAQYKRLIGHFEGTGKVWPEPGAEPVKWTATIACKKALGGHYLRGSGEEEYQARPGEQIPDEHKEVSTVLLRFKEGNTMAGFQLRQDINLRGKEATLAWPIGNVMADAAPNKSMITSSAPSAPPNATRLANATNVDAAPPVPLNAATSSGMDVNGTRTARVAPIPPPINRPMPLIVSDTATVRSPPNSA